MTLPVVGLPVCASGNQVEGKLGTLKAKPKKKPQKTRLPNSNARSGGEVGKGFGGNRATSNVPVTK
ncbi:MAG: hypothetical protein R3A44_39155 [Caldilineaceae bacterium]